MSGAAMRRAHKGGRGSHEDYAALPKYDRQPVEEHGSIEAALGRGSGPACMWLLALQVITAALSSPSRARPFLCATSGACCWNDDVFACRL